MKLRQEISFRYVELWRDCYTNTLPARQPNGMFCHGDLGLIISRQKVKVDDVYDNEDLDVFVVLNNFDTGWINSWFLEEI